MRFAAARRLRRTSARAARAVWRPYPPGTTARAGAAPEDRDALKAGANDIFDAIDATIKEGQVDGGASLSVSPDSLTFVAGVHLKEPAKVEDALKKINWARSNTKFWEGRAMLGGRVQKAEQNVTLTTNLIKKFLGLRLSPEERRVEQAYMRGRNGK